MYSRYSFLIKPLRRNSERMIFVLPFYEKPSLIYQDKSENNEVNCEYIVGIRGKLFQRFVQQRGSDTSMHPEAMHLMEFIEMIKLRKSLPN